jgi:hypothetical protein
MILSNSALDGMLKTIIEARSLYHHFAYSYFEDLYYTGCRSTEPLLIDRWFFKGNMVCLNTLKTEAVRFFIPEKLSNDLLISIVDKRAPYNGLTYDQLTFEFRKQLPKHPIYAGKRIADTYLFRYNRARQIFDNTNSLAAVQDFFGWNSMEMASNYVHQPLRYEPSIIKRL